MRRFVALVMTVAATGRKVMDLHTGANDVSRLASGVCFVRLAAGDSSGTEKLVLQRKGRATCTRRRAPH